MALINDIDSDLIGLACTGTSKNDCYRVNILEYIMGVAFNILNMQRPTKEKKRQKFKVSKRPPLGLVKIWACTQKKRMFTITNGEW